MAQIGVQGVQKVQIRSIRLIRGKKKQAYPLAYCLPGRDFTMSYIPRALPPVTHGSAFQAPECLWGPIRGRIESTGQVFIYVYRLAIDARTLRGDDVGG